MRTALQKLLCAIDFERAENQSKRIEYFSFKFGKVQIDFLGHYYAYVLRGRKKWRR